MYKIYPVLFLLLPLCGHGHGDLHLRIAKLSEQIERDPGVWSLYQSRGELYLQHGDLIRAKRDFRKFERHGVLNRRFYFFKAKTHYHLKNYARALRVIDGALQSDKDDMKSWRLKAKILSSLKRDRESALCYEHILTHAVATFPENYVDASCAWIESGRGEKGVEVLERGIQHLGRVPILYKALIDQYRVMEAWYRVIALQTEMLNAARRKEFIYYERALTFRKKGKLFEAYSDLLASQEEIKKLPERLQRTPALIELRDKVSIAVDDIRRHTPIKQIEIYSK